MGVTRPESKSASSPRLPSTIKNAAIEKSRATASQSNAIARKVATQMIGLTGEPQPAPISKLISENIFSASFTCTGKSSDDILEDIGLYTTVEDANDAARAYLKGEQGEAVNWDEFKENLDNNLCLHITGRGLQGEIFGADVKITKLHKRIPPTPQARTLPVPLQPRASSAKAPIPRGLKSTKTTFPDYDDVYVVSCTHTIPYASNETNVMSLHRDLDDANDFARRYIADKSPDLFGWDKYGEHINCDEGGILITAESMDIDSYIVTVRAKTLKRKPQIQQIAPPPRRSPSPELSEVYLVTVECRKFLCGSNEDGELDSVEVRKAFKTLEDAEDFAEEEMEKQVADGEWHRDEGKEGGMLVLEAREWCREEQVIVRVSEVDLE